MRRRVVEKAVGSTFAITDAAATDEHSASPWMIGLREAHARDRDGVDEIASGCGARARTAARIAGEAGAQDVRTSISAR